MSDNNPRLVVIEGPDGTGKSTQVEAVVRALASAGVTAEAFHHEAPSRREDVRTRWQRALAFAAQRAALDARLGVINCDVVVCDRWWHSTHVEAVRRCDSALGSLAHAENRALPTPAIVVVLDAPDRVLNERLKARGESVTSFDRDCRAIYREAVGDAKLWTRTLPMEPVPAPLVVIDTSGEPVETTRRIATEIMDALGLPLVGWDADGREVARVG